MDKQPLNTGEQKDMAEFFTDLISKLEEMDDNLVSVAFNVGSKIKKNLDLALSFLLVVCYPLHYFIRSVLHVVI